MLISDSLLARLGKPTQDSILAFKSAAPGSEAQAAAFVDFCNFAGNMGAMPDGAKTLDQARAILAAVSVAARHLRVSGGVAVLAKTVVPASAGPDAILAQLASLTGPAREAFVAQHGPAIDAARLHRAALTIAATAKPATKPAAKMTDAEIHASYEKMPSGPARQAFFATHEQALFRAHKAHMKSADASPSGVAVRTGNMTDSEALAKYEQMPAGPARQAFFTEHEAAIWRAHEAR